MAASGRSGQGARGARRIRKNAGSALKALLVALLVVAALALAALGWLVMGYADEPGPGHGKLVELTLEPGVTVRALAARLAGQGALAEPLVFEIYARLRLAGAQLFGATDTRLREGTVALYDDMTPQQLLQRIAYGFGFASLRVVLPEGYTRYDIAERLERFGICSAHDFIAATEDAALLAELGVQGPSAEGYLFPDTYSLREGSDPRNVVRRLVRHGREQTEKLFAEHADALAALGSEVGLDAHDVVTLASIVEREAGVAEERPIIAGVFLNRLKDPAFTPKRLQADPTVIYGCRAQPSLGSCAGFDPKKPRITKAMLLDGDNPYNTYRRQGLPPGPISNPGRAALAAVLAPAQHDYLYFVATGGGRHTFSATLDAHNSAVQRGRDP